ncbi:MAG: LpqB family beta-propeller domain-containing protein [Micrococcales bacterium]
MRRLQILAVVTTALLVLSGCAQLPRSSEVKTGPDLKSGLTTDYLYYSPSGPSEGDDQAQIINGFLNAATGPQNDYQIAREYLTADFSSKWSPNDEVLIQESRPEFSLQTETSARLTVKAVAQIDSVGLWTSYPGTQIRNLDFKLVKENNQWRISSAPNATVLVKPVFDVLFKSYSLYFYDGQNKYLVPDLRWFSSRVSTGTRLVNALLKGPNRWLAGSVNNAFPAGTKLALDAVTVENGSAVVDLNAAATKADKPARSRMLSQLTATLNQLTNVFSVKIQIDHNPQDIVLQNSQLPYPSNYVPMVLDAGGIRQVSQDPQKDKISAIAKRLNAKDFGFSPDGGYLALSSANGIDLARVNVLSSEVTKIDSRANQLAPVIDNRSQIWSLPRKASEPIQVHDVTGKTLFSSAGWLSQGEHLGFGISREGARLAILLKTKNGTALYVAAIKRDATGYPIGIDSPRRVDFGIGTLKSVSWSGANTLAAIATGTTSGDVPTNIQVGGGSSEMTALTDIVSMVAQTDSSSTFVLDRNGILFEYRGMSWIAVETDVKSAHFTGN